MLKDIRFLEDPEYIWEENEQHMIFIGGIDGKSREYMILPRDYKNDGRIADGRVIWFAVSWSGNAGSIYKVKITELEGGKTNINYVIKNLPIGRWKNAEQVVQWQTKQRTKEDSLKLLNKTREDSIELYLRPVSVVYDKLKTKSERAVLLARIIEYITSGRI